MKDWTTPSIESLSVRCTENGKSMENKIDEIRVDQFGNYWASRSGEGPEVDDNGNIVIPKKVG